MSKRIKNDIAAEFANKKNTRNLWSKFVGNLSNGLAMIVKKL